MVSLLRTGMCFYLIVESRTVVDTEKPLIEMFHELQKFYIGKATKSNIPENAIHEYRYP